MTRTQIYLPEDTHQALTQLAKRKKTSLSHLLRLGAQKVLVDEYENNDPLSKALDFFANPPQHAQLSLTGEEAIAKIREEREDD